jgi:hypothetical protein
MSASFRVPRCALFEQIGDNAGSSASRRSDSSGIDMTRDGRGPPASAASMTRVRGSIDR